MESASHREDHQRLPTLSQLGEDLLQTSWSRLARTLAMPFCAMGCYLLFAWLRWWPLAVISVMVLSFVTYGSTSHDLVHRTLRLPHRWNDILLSLIELLSLRSGTAYRLSHLHHHRHLLEHDDIEGAAAHGTLIGSLGSGIVMQPRLWLWAWQKYPALRARLLVEALGIGTFLILAVVSLGWTPAPAVYVVLVIAGSWLFPLITVYFPHDARTRAPLAQTRLFRGRLLQLIAFDHLYHLEHHLYPAVPHHHWKTLAQRLDPHWERLGVKPYPVPGLTPHPVA